MFYAEIPLAGLGAVAAWLFAAATLVTLAATFSRRWRLRALGVFAVLVALLAIWWSAIEPSRDREWLPELVSLPYAEIRGDLVTVYIVRNFEYRSETEFMPRYEKRNYDLRQLAGIDLFTAHWMGPAVAHVIISFVFEARKRRGQGYSSTRGFLRQQELIYVVADERDLIRLRAH